MNQSSLFPHIKGSLFVKLATIFFLGMTVWWLMIFFQGLKDTNQNNAFTLIYPLLSLAGGVAGLVYAKKWGGLKSILGLAISFFAFGLLAQFFGQAAYAYYIYVKGIAVPYPSIGDVGYFGSVIFYIFGAYFLAKVSGLKNSMRSVQGKLVVVIVPLVMLILSYSIFLKGYQFDATNPIKTFLDFGYPFGQAIYVSIAILALTLCQNVLGGIMKRPLIFMLFALVLQYLSDFMFLYQSNAGTWYVGGFNDYMYLASYFLMTVALVNIGGVFNTIKEA